MTMDRCASQFAGRLLLAGGGHDLRFGHQALADENKRRAAGSPPTLLPSPSNPLVAIRVVFRAGSQCDPPGKEGLAALTAAMVAEGGTKSLTLRPASRGVLPDGRVARRATATRR